MGKPCWDRALGVRKGPIELRDVEEVCSTAPAACKTRKMKMSTEPLHAKAADGARKTKRGKQPKLPAPPSRASYPGVDLR